MKTKVALVNRNLAIIIIFMAAHYFAPQAMKAQDQAGAGAGTGVTPATGPALNIISTPSRPPIPAPPETPQASQPGMLQQGNRPSLPQAWRVKALQLFKPNNNLDKSSVLALHMQSAYGTVFDTTARALASSGLSIDSVSFSSGHMLVSRPNENGMVERAIIALKQAAPDSDSSASSGTDVRAFCDNRNRGLTISQIRGILFQVDAQADAQAGYNTGSGARAGMKTDTGTGRDFGQDFGRGSGRGSMSDSSRHRTGAESL